MPKAGLQRPPRLPARRPDPVRNFAPGGTPYGTAPHTKRRSHADRSIGAGMPVRCAYFHWTAGRAGDSPAAADDSEALPRAVPRAGIRDCFAVPPARNVRRLVGVRRVAAGYSQRPAQCQCGSVTACGLRPGPCGQHVHGPCQVERVSFRLSRHRGSRRPVPSSLFSHNEGPTDEHPLGGT
jgi:hypothetical protein